MNIYSVLMIQISTNCIVFDSFLAVWVKFHIKGNMYENVCR